MFPAGHPWWELPWVFQARNDVVTVSWTSKRAICPRDPGSPNVRGLSGWGVKNHLQNTKYLLKVPWNHAQKVIGSLGQVIQAVTFWFPIVGEHRCNLSNHHVNSPSQKKGISRIAVVLFFFGFPFGRNHGDMNGVVMSCQLTTIVFLPCGFLVVLQPVYGSSIVWGTLKKVVGGNQRFFDFLCTLQKLGGGYDPIFDK